MEKNWQVQQSGRGCGLGVSVFADVVKIDAPNNLKHKGSQEDIARHGHHVDPFRELQANAAKNHEDDRNRKYEVDANLPADLARRLVDDGLWPLNTRGLGLRWGFGTRFVHE